MTQHQKFRKGTELSLVILFYFYVKDDFGIGAIHFWLGLSLMLITYWNNVIIRDSHELTNIVASLSHITTIVLAALVVFGLAIQPESTFKVYLIAISIGFLGFFFNQTIRKYSAVNRKNSHSERT